MKVALTLVSSGKILDTITVSDDGQLGYDTGAARPVVRSIKQVMGDEWLKAVADWSNGYLALRDTSLTAAFAYDPDQPRDRKGRWTDGGRGAPAVPSAGTAPDAPTRGAPGKLTQDDFKERPGDEDEDVSARAGDRIAERWDVSDEDLMALAAVDGAPDWLSGIPEGERKAAYARRLIGQWNSSSGGPIPTAAITRVADRLGLGYTLEDSEQRTNAYIRGNEALDRATGSFGEAMYAATQAWLAERGITEVQAYRSGRGKEWDDNRPFTSWAGSAGGTKGAAGDKNFRDEVVPASRIFSVPPAGFGTMHESELVLLPPGDASVTAAFRFDPGQPRDPDGKWGDGLPGSLGGGDRLQIGGRIDLAPGEQLLGSAKVKIDNDNNESEMLVAATDGPGGRQLRIGIPPPDYSDPEYDDEGEQIERVAWTGNDPDDTVRLDAAGLDQMRADFDRHTRTAKAWQAEANRNFDMIERLEGQYHEAYSAAQARRDPDTLVIAPEDRAKIDAIRAELEPLYDWQEDFEPDAMIAEGVIPGVPGHGGLVYEVEGDDLGKFGWNFRFAVKPSDAPSDWSVRDSDAVVMSTADQARFQRQITSMIDSAVTAAATFRFDPNQPRDRDGQWTSGGMGGVGVLSDFDAWSAQAADPGSVTGDDLFRIGSKVGKIMSRDGASMGDPAALFRAVQEAVAEDDSDITARQYVRAMDRDYGTSLDRGITDALAAAQPAATPREVPTVSEPTAAGDYSPSFSASYAHRQRQLQEGIDSGVADAEELAGGAIASTHALTWNDGSRSVLKEAKRTVRDRVTPKEQTDAEELAGIVADAVGVRAPVAQRVSDNEIYLEYMPGVPGARKYGSYPPRDVITSEDGVSMGLLDQLVGNPDRHAGNWTVDDDGNMYAIDHGLAFTAEDYETFGPFADHLINGRPESMSAARLKRVRADIEGLRGEFVRLGRRDWHDQMMGRMEALETRLGERAAA